MRHFYEETNSLKVTSKQILVKERHQQLITYVYRRGGTQKMVKKRQNICLKCAFQTVAKISAQGQQGRTTLNGEAGFWHASFARVKWAFKFLKQFQSARISVFGQSKPNKRRHPALKKGNCSRNIRSCQLKNHYQRRRPCCVSIP